jgi:hypothetical protein
MERLRGVLGGVIGTAGAFVSSLCCVLPVAVILLGLGSGAFMATTMTYTSVFIPVGVLSLTVGFYLHFRERRRCTLERCRMAGGTLNIVLLTFSAMVVVTALFFTVFPALSSEVLMWAASGRGAGASQPMDMPMDSTSRK